MFNQSNPRLWFAGFVLSGLFSIESIDPEGWRLGGHWHVASHFCLAGRCLLRVRQGFLRVTQVESRFGHGGAVLGIVAAAGFWAVRTFF